MVSRSIFPKIHVSGDINAGWASGTITDTEDVTDFVSLIGYRANNLLVINDGPNSVYVAVNSTASTNDFELKNGEFISIPVLVDSLHLICNSGETANVRIFFTVLE